MGNTQDLYALLASSGFTYLGHTYDLVLVEPNIEGRFMLRIVDIEGPLVSEQIYATKMGLMLDLELALQEATLKHILKESKPALKGAQSA